MSAKRGSVEDGDRIVTASPWSALAGRLESWSQSDRLTTVLAWATFASGTLWRWKHILRLHDPRDYVYSDMGMYVDLAKRFADPGYKLAPSDLTHPPGFATVMSWLIAGNPTLQTMVYFQFVVCTLVPLVVGALGWVAFGRTTGRMALIAASLYFPFVDYGGYFLTEIHFTFSLPLGVTLALMAARQQKVGLAAIFGLLSGFAFSLATATKVLAFPAVACFLFAFLAAWRGTRGGRRLRSAAVLALAIGAAPITSWQVVRCTEANHGFCFGSNKGASDFLLGHYGRIGTIRWRDPEAGETWFGSPSAAQHGYGDRVDVDFGVTDTAKNFELAFQKIKERPQQAVLLSLEHVYDLFFGSFPWPSSATTYWVGAAGGHYVFICFLLFPTCVRLLDLARDKGLRALLGSIEALLLAPVVGLVVTVALATGEPRYRIPFDSLFMVVALEFYRRLFAPQAEKAAERVVDASMSMPSVAPDRSEGAP